MTDAPAPTPADSQTEAVPLSDASFGDWLSKEMDTRNISITQLAELTGLTYAGIWNIVKGNTKAPRIGTREKITKVIGVAVPPDVANAVERQSEALPGFEWVDFTPSDLETVPEAAGVYVFYDVTDRPVYVGKSKTNVRSRVKDHQTRFWFKEPLVVRGAFLAVPDAELCLKIEGALIKFLGKHALLNVKGANRDYEE